MCQARFCEVDMETGIRSTRRCRTRDAETEKVGRKGPGKEVQTEMIDGIVGPYTTHYLYQSLQGRPGRKEGQQCLRTLNTEEPAQCGGPLGVLGV